MATGASGGFDRHRELKAFDDTKAGVKGLVDAGVLAVPPIFHHPPDSVAPSSANAPNDVAIPVVDLADATTTSRRGKLVAELKAAAKTVGFFQVVNHGVPAAAMAEMLAATRRFHEEPAQAKRPYYTRDAKNVSYTSNFDLFESPAANWRDTLYLRMDSNGPAPDDIPPACRGILFEYTKLMRELGSTLFELLSEALGLDRRYLERMGCLQTLTVVGQYYPPCPEPHLTLGISKHSDPSFLTMVLQDGIGGLQILIADKWVDVPTLPGAFVVNIGDLLQIASNDKFKSVEHRVVAKSIGPRVSVACFLNMSINNVSSKLNLPIPELISDASPPLYRNIPIMEYFASYRKRGLDGRPTPDYFRL